ncbi:MAG: biotin transporter BioY [Bacillota bacterium]
MAKKITIVGMFAALTAVGGLLPKLFIGPVPFTFQFVFCCLAGLILGSKLGALSQFIYVALGLIGLPIFAKGGGPQYVFEPTFGYLAGFILSAFVIGLIIEKLKPTKIENFLVASFAGMLLLYVPGVSYMYLILNFYKVGASMSFGLAFFQGFAIFLPSGIVFCILASIIAKKVRRFV